MALEKKKVVDHLLDVPVELPGDLMAKFEGDNVHERASLVAEGVFGEDPADQFAMFHNHLVWGGGVRGGGREG